MKKIFLPTVIVAAATLISILFSGCEKDRVQKYIILFSWESFDWITDAYRDFYLDSYNGDAFVFATEDELHQHFGQIFSDYNFAYPNARIISEDEYRIYRYIVETISRYSFSSRVLRDHINSVHRDMNFQILDYDAKTRVTFFVKMLIGVSEAIETIGLENSRSTRQPPRTYYNSPNGNSRFERQLNNCLAYQLDGHFETLASAAQYIASMPWGFIWDTAICGNEIIDGLWEHVR